MRISDWSSDVCSSDLTQSMFWRDDLRMIREDPERMINRLRRCSKLHEKDPAKFIQNGPGRDGSDDISPPACGDSDIGKTAWFDQSGNKDIRIKNNPHLMFSFRGALFLAEFLDRPVDVFFGPDAHSLRPLAGDPLRVLPQFFTHKVRSGKLAKKIGSCAKLVPGLLVDKLHKFRRHGQIKSNSHEWSSPADNYIQTLYGCQYA